MCGANQIFTQKLWLKHSVKVLHCQITLTTHKYDYVRLKQGSDSRFRAIRAYNHKVSALRQVPDSLCRWYASTYQSPRTGRWVPVTAGPDPLWCCLPSLPGSRVPPGCHWQHKTCGWGQLHSGPRLMPLLCWAPTEQTEHCYSPVSPASQTSNSEKLSFLIALFTHLHSGPNFTTHLCNKNAKRGPPTQNALLSCGFSY